MSTALRPVLRPSLLPSLSPHRSPTSYICQACRHARLLRRPKRPYTFTQLVTLSDGSAFTMRTTSPLPVYRSSRDTRNAPLWNPSSAELLNVEEDEAGRLAGFRSRFGTAYDASKGASTTMSADAVVMSEEQKATKDQEVEKQQHAQKPAAKAHAEDLNFGFEDDDDAGILEMISKYGTADKGKPSQISKKRQ